MSPNPPAPVPDLSKVRHELRTPINHILGYCDILLEDDQVPESFHADLLKIHNGGHQLLSLINHYFDEKTFASLKLDPHQLFHELRTPVNHIIGYSELLEEMAGDHGATDCVKDLRKINTAAQTWLALMEEHLLPGATVEQVFVDPGIGFVTPVPKSAAPPAPQAGELLVVDDDPANREMLARRLQKEGYSITHAENGLQAIKLLRSRPFDLLLLDLIMPGLDGYQVLARLKADAELKHVPIIMISALDQENGIARCIELGAEDYIAKPFNPVFLRARIGASLEKKRLRDQEQRTYKALLKSQQKIAANLAEAARYVESLLPPKLNDAVVTDYLFKPSSQLGGDIFGYHWLNESHLAIYLLDVSGHGVGAALLSVSVMNVIRARTLGHVDFRSPGAVLTALNDTFPMDQNGQLFFTVWYGVYDRNSRVLQYASGGHPPALLLRGRSIEQLRTNLPAIGCLPDYPFAQQSVRIDQGDQLLVLSDGVYELQHPNGVACTYAGFVERIRGLKVITPATILSGAQTLQERESFEDDFSLLQVTFP